MYTRKRVPRVQGRPSFKNTDLNCTIKTKRQDASSVTYSMT